MEAWHEWQTGQDRQSGTISPGAVDLTVIFPPVDVIQVLPGGVHAVLPLTSPLEVFCTISTVFVCMDSVRGPHQTLSKNKYNICDIANMYTQSKLQLNYTTLYRTGRKELAAKAIYFTLAFAHTFINTLLQY